MSRDKQHHVRLLIQAQDAERRRLSFELHDELGQTLAALEIGLAELEGRLEGSDQGRAAGLRGMVTRASSELRRLAQGLHPRVLEDHGLEVALERLAAECRSLAKIPVTLRVATDCTLGGDAALAVYRVIQEALTNAVKHAVPGSICIDLARHDDRVEGSIDDDGHGFVTDESSERAGLGLRSMRERIEQLGGRFRVRSHPGDGTTVSFEFPVPPRESA